MDSELISLRELRITKELVEKFKARSQAQRWSRKGQQSGQSVAGRGLLKLCMYQRKRRTCCGYYGSDAWTAWEPTSNTESQWSRPQKLRYCAGSSILGDTMGISELRYGVVALLIQSHDWRAARKLWQQDVLLALAHGNNTRGLVTKSIHDGLYLKLLYANRRARLPCCGRLEEAEMTH